MVERQVWIVKVAMLDQRGRRITRSCVVNADDAAAARAMGRTEFMDEGTIIQAWAGAYRTPKIIDHKTRTLLTTGR